VRTRLLKLMDAADDHYGASVFFESDGGWRSRSAPTSFRNAPGGVPSVPEKRHGAKPTSRAVGQTNLPPLQSSPPSIEPRIFQNRGTLTELAWPISDPALVGRDGVWSAGPSSTCAAYNGVFLSLKHTCSRNTMIGLSPMAGCLPAQTNQKPQNCRGPSWNFVCPVANSETCRTQVGCDGGKYDPRRSPACAQKKKKKFLLSNNSG